MVPSIGTICKAACPAITAHRRRGPLYVNSLPSISSHPRHTVLNFDQYISSKFVIASDNSYNSQSSISH